MGNVRRAEKYDTLSEEGINSFPNDVDCFDLFLI
jgi:hypothetical protein